jgi:hypothetical protein
MNRRAMSSRRPRSLQFYWEHADGVRARAAWRHFISEWIIAHDDDRETAESHWLSYVEEFMQLRKFEHLSGAPLTRKAESGALRWLTVLHQSKSSCKYCGTLDDVRGSKR